MKKNFLSGNAISLVTCGVLLSSSLSFGADSIGTAFKDGKASGSLALYGEHHDYKDGDANTGFGNGNATVGFETGSFYGFNAKAEFKGNLDLGEVDKGNRDDSFQNNSLMTEAYIKYTMDGLAVSAGRQAIDLEWMGDYHEAVVTAITAIPDTTVVLGYSQRKAESGIDVSEGFSEFNDDEGAYVLDVKYAGLKTLEFNPYAYSVPNLANWYGLKTTFTTDMFGAIAHYAASNEDVVDVKDGSIGHVELNTTIADFTAAVGYIKTDKANGAGSMDSVGDNISPFDAGLSTYASDAKTAYGSVGYTIADVELGALYGQTKYDADYKEKELNLTVDYSITESIATSLLYGHVNADEAGEASKGDDASSDDKYFLASVEYTF